MKALLTSFLAMLVITGYAQTLTVSPSSGSKGQSLSILFSGTGLNFSQGSNAAYVEFQQGSSTFWTYNTQVLDANHMIGSTSIPPYANCGSYTAVVFTQGSNTLTFNNAFTVDCGSSISGHVYSDLDNNGANNGEPGLKYTAVRLQPGDITAYTDYYGDYTFTVAPGNYTVSVIPSGHYTQTSSPATYNANTSVTTNISGLDFGLYEPPFNDVSVSLYSPNLRVGFARTSWININNEGTTSQSPSVVLTLDSLVTLTSCSYPYTTSGHTYTITPGVAVQPHDYFDFSIELTAAVSAPMGQTTALVATLSNELANDVTTANNSVSTIVTFTNSFDPNDKSVSPAGVGPQNETLKSAGELTYLVRFQNTGNDVAYLVRVADTLDSNLDLTSFRLLGSSHPVTFDMKPNGEVMFTFDNINLPAKSVDEPGSNGFVSYAIRPQANLVEGTVIANTAHIFFDFNGAIVTNTTTSKMVSTYTGILDESVARTFSIYPNPSATTLHIRNEAAQISDVTMYDMLGAVVMTQPASGTSTQISTAGMTAGVYVLRIRTDRGDLMQRVTVMH